MKPGCTVPGQIWPLALQRQHGPKAKWAWTSPAGRRAPRWSPRPGREWRRSHRQQAGQRGDAEAAAEAPQCFEELAWQGDGGRSSPKKFSGGEAI
jgi:hypothetical protein